MTKFSRRKLVDLTVQIDEKVLCGQQNYESIFFLNDDISRMENAVDDTSHIG